MDKKIVTYELLEDLMTVEEAEKLISSIDSILDNLFKVKNKGLDQILSKSIGVSQSSILKEVFIQCNVSNSDFSSAESILSNLREQLKEVKTVKLTLAIDPTREFISSVYGWISQNISKEMLLDIDKDDSILGGAIISVDGRYKDFSLKSRLEDVFVNKKSEIIKLLKPKLQ